MSGEKVFQTRSKGGTLHQQSNWSCGSLSALLVCVSITKTECEFQPVVDDTESRVSLCQEIITALGTE